jgi:hypothetical protein
MALVFVAEPFDAMTFHEQSGSGSIQRLNGGFLIDRQHDRILRRLHV